MQEIAENQKPEADLRHDQIKSRGLTRDAIKMIAMLTMFFNHFSHVFLTAGTYPAEFLKGIGDFTAPVMCYFLAEGFYKTSSRRAYAKRLFVFALVSQVPYFLAFNGEAAGLNMMFSLLFSFLILCVLHGEAFLQGKGQLQIAGLFFLSVFSDWSVLAPAFTLLFDRAGQDREKIRKTFLLVTVLVGVNEAAALMQSGNAVGVLEGIVCVLFSMTGSALAGLCILYGYNGERAKKGRQFLKWFFYGFYPVHLLLLWLAARAMGTM